VSLDVDARARALYGQPLPPAHGVVHVVAESGLDVGERATLSLRVPGSQVWLDAEAEITRVVRGRRLGDAGVAYGLRLRRMDGMSRVLLGQIARGRPEVSSARGERRDYARTIARIHAE